MFTACFNISEFLSNIYHHKLHNLQDALWTPLHTFNITDFSVWKLTKTFLNDLLCRTLHFATSINIGFDLSTLLMLAHLFNSQKIRHKLKTLRIPNITS